MVMEPDAVVGSIAPHALADLLTAIHRAGHGHNTRVFDPRRGDFDGQLARAGIPTNALALERRQDDAIVLIHAPRRAEQAAELLRRAGAADVQPIVIGRQSASTLLTFDPATLAKKPRRPARRRPAPVPTTLDDGAAEPNEQPGEPASH